MRSSSYREPAVFALPELALLPGVGDRVHKLIAWGPAGQSSAPALPRQKVTLRLPADLITAYRDW